MTNAPDLAPETRVRVVDLGLLDGAPGRIIAVDARSIVGNRPLYRVALDDGRTLGYVGARYLTVDDG